MLFKTSWRLQDAEAQFSAVVDAALNGRPQFVTCGGKRAVVVLDASEYERLRRSAGAEAPDFIGHLLAMPRSAKTVRNAAAKRRSIRLRAVVFE